MTILIIFYFTEQVSLTVHYFHGKQYLTIIVVDIMGNNF